jgi:predicted MFS family arabinose efflux permease
MEPPSISSSGFLWSREILFLFGATFLAYANISVFFSYYEYLGTLAIDRRWFGLLISAFSAASLIARPLLIPFIHRGNAYGYLFGGTLLLVATLCAYSLATGFWAMLFVRSLHGLCFVLLGAALMTITVDYIPAERSAQFFGFLSIIVLIPNTAIPPLLPLLTQGLGGFTMVLFLFAGITALVMPLVHLAGGSRSLSGAQKAAVSPGKAAIMANLGNGLILSILFSMLLLYSSYALVFFFLEGFGRAAGISGTGFFLTLSTLGEIGVRLAAGSLLDRMNKVRLASLTMGALALAYAALGQVRGQEAFFVLGLLFGLGWGVAMPLFNGLMFDLSEPGLRAFNTNLGFQMFQGGFFLGPFIGAPVVARWGFTTLFELCAVLCLISAVLTFCMEKSIKRARQDADARMLES